MTDTETVERITHAQAATLLGCHTRTISKLVQQGRLTSTGARGPGVGALDLDQVLQLRERRAQAAAARRLRYDPRRHGPPDDEHEWLDPTQVAERLGVTDKAVHARARRGTIPHVRCGRRVWIRADHLKVWQRARQVTGSGDLRIVLGSAHSHWTRGGTD